MATYVHGGVDAFNAMAFCQPSAEDISFFQRNTQAFQANLGHTGQQFFNNMQARMQILDFDKLKEYAQAAARRVSSFWQSDAIRPLQTLADQQFPPSLMIRWQMTNPNIRELYHKNLCEGYGDKYIDPQPGVSGEFHHEWRMVMHGMEQQDKEGNLFWQSFDEEFDDHERSMNFLTVPEKHDILMSWQHADDYVFKQKDDPTSQFSGML